MASYSARTKDEVQAAIAAGKTIHILTPEIDESRIFEEHYTFVRDESDRRVRLGSGVYGSVYTARAIPELGAEVMGSDVDAMDQTDQLFAVKEIDKLHALKSVKTETGFQRCVRSMRTEVEVLREMRKKEGRGKEFTLGLVDVFECATHIRIVTEYCGGGDLLSKTSGKRLTESDVMRSAWQVTLALRYLHDECSAVHCDLKPQNVMFKDKSHKSLRVIDFGMARIIKAGDLLSDPCGSAYYTAPEIINTRTRKAAYSQPCDIWSLGNIVFVLLCRYPAFAVDASKYEDNRKVRRAIYRKILAGFHPVVYEARTAGYGPWFVDTIPMSKDAQDWIGSCLIANPERRFTAAQLLEHPWFEPIRRTLPPIKVTKLFSPVLLKSDTTPAFDSDTFAWSTTPDGSNPDGLDLAIPPLSPASAAAASTPEMSPMIPRLASPSLGTQPLIPDGSEQYLEIWNALGKYRWREWNVLSLISVLAEQIVRKHNPMVLSCLEEIFDDMKTTAQTLRSAREQDSSEPEYYDSTRSLSMSHSISPQPSASLTTTSVVSTSKSKSGSAGVDFAAFCVRMRLMRKRVSVEKLRRVWGQLTQPRLEEQCSRILEESPMISFDRRAHIELRDLKRVIIIDYLKKNDWCVIECFQSINDEIAADKLMDAERHFKLDDSSPFSSPKSDKKQSKFYRKVKARRKLVMDEEVKSKYKSSDELIKQTADTIESREKKKPIRLSQAASSIESETEEEVEYDDEEEPVVGDKSGKSASELTSKLLSLAVKFKFPPPTMSETAVDLSRADSTNMSLGSRTSSTSLFSICATSISANSPSLSRSTSVSSVTSLSSSMSQQRGGWMDMKRTKSTKSRTKKTIKATKAKHSSSTKSKTTTSTTTSTTTTTTALKSGRSKKRKRAVSKPRLQDRYGSGSLIRQPYRSPMLVSKSSLPLSFGVPSGSGSPFTSPVSPAVSDVISPPTSMSTPPQKFMDSDDKSSPVFSSSHLSSGLVCIDVKSMIKVYCDQCNMLNYSAWTGESTSILNIQIIRQLKNEDLLSAAQFSRLFQSR